MYEKNLLLTLKGIPLNSRISQMANNHLSLKKTVNEKC